MPGRGNGNGTRNQFLPLARVHCTAGFRWGTDAATDYWLDFNSGYDLLQATAANTDPLPDAGWTATSLVNTAGSGADFMGGTYTMRNPAGAFGDAGIPNHALTNASGDLLASPAIFGDAAHAYQASRLVGRNAMPRVLSMEFFGSFSVASADETTSAIGLFEDGATVSVEADQYAVIRSNGTNFLLQGNAATMATGPAIDTGWHLWRIDLVANGNGVAPNVFAYQDGVIFSTTPGIGAQDEFPLKIGMHALTTNRPLLGLTHVFYDW